VNDDSLGLTHILMQGAGRYEWKKKDSTNKLQGTLKLHKIKFLTKISVYVKEQKILLKIT
jgi:hypothetical protein